MCDMYDCFLCLLRINFCCWGFDYLFFLSNLRKMVWKRTAAALCQRRHFWIKNQKYREIQNPKKRTFIYIVNKVAHKG